MSTSILIVTYNCPLNRSETIRSLLASKPCFDGTHLCIWNNGPKEVPSHIETIAALNKKGFTISLKQTPWNAPLSWIYNYFTENFTSDYYAILDHDSRLSEEYIQHILSPKNTFLGMPIIRAKGALHYPRQNGHFSAGPYSKNDNVRSIGTGLLLSIEAINSIKSRYGNLFDEHFALYGVDTSIFKRIHRLRLTDRLESIPGFEHSLSKLEKENKETKRQRKIERSYDIGLTLRHYPSTKSLNSLVKQIIKRPFGKNKILIKIAIKAFIQGHHERCKNTIFKDSF